MKQNPCMRLPLSTGYERRQTFPLTTPIAALTSKKLRRGLREIGSSVANQRWHEKRRQRQQIRERVFAEHSRK